MRGSNHFDKTIWICVSTNFNVEDITRKMLSELGESSCSGTPLNALQETLKEKIHLKKILLVLDDIWDDEKRSEWEQLVAPLRFVQEGSKILFTTRMKSVADLLASVISMKHESLVLQGLCDQELRLLFYSYAFHGFNLDNHRILQAIGDQILKMLRGSPLAAKVIGSLLNSRMDHQYWTKILNDGSIFNLEQAKDVVEVLKLSYYHLPTNLQVCFRFCSIFPPDHEFDKVELIKMWMASGFIRQKLCLEERPEDIGEEYFNYLLRKSFFQYAYESRKGARYVMHDLMHELARNVSTNECCRIESNEKSTIIPNTVRHVSVHESEIKRVSHLENLRTLIITTSAKRTGTYPGLFVLPNNLIKKPLRVLEIHGSKYCELPEEISCLVHLRYLSIECYYVTQSFKYLLLASIYKLYHLQVLEFPRALNTSSNSSIETTGMSNLVRLLYMRLPDEIMQNIHRVSKMTSLQELTFFVGKESGHHINELGPLNNLRHLSIKRIENIGDPADVNSANILGKNNLLSLSLKWTSESNPDNPEQIIDYLQPHPNLMELTIENYKGQKSPSWMESPLNLSSLRLISCPMWKNQLFSGQMPYLKILDICDCLNLDKLPDMPLSLIEFRICYVAMIALPDLYQSSDDNNPQPLSLKSSLRVVEIKSCPNLISLNGFLQQDNLDLQAIVELTINDCEKLVQAPIDIFGKLLALKHLNIKDCQNLTRCPSIPLSLTHFCIDNIGVNALPEYYQSSDSRGGPSTSSPKSSLRNVEIKSCPNLIALNGFLQQDNIDFQSFKKIEVNNCRNLVHILISAFGSFVSLMKLTIMDCPLLARVDNQSSLLPMKLKSLDMVNCGEHDVPLLESASHLTTLTDLLINSCANISHIPSENSFRSLNELLIFGCKKLVENSSREQAHGSDQRSSLAFLKINCLCIDHLSLLLIEPLKSLRSVSFLYVSYCTGMEGLPEQWLLQNSTTLRSLIIRDARSLKSLPATMASLTVLEEVEILEADLLDELPELPASLKKKYIEGQKLMLKKQKDTVFIMEQLKLKKQNQMYSG